MKNKEDILKKYICIQPFKHIEFFEDHATLCCPTWLETKLWYGKNEDGTLNYDVWKSETANKIRESVLDGSYSHCHKTACPHLSTLINTQNASGFFVEKEKLPFKMYDGFVVDDKNISSGPGSINFTYDDSCNLKCPSCRLHVIMAKPNEIIKIDNITDFIKNNYSKEARKLAITGSGDPWASKSFRKFLFEFDPKLWPKLDDIYLTTNANLFNEKNWKKIEKAHPYVKSVEISIDAATKDTYENKTRIGGNWEVLMENLDFISTIPTIQNLRCSFVTQLDNYKEMREFAELIYKKFENRIQKQQYSEATLVYFGKIYQWTHMDYESFKHKAVWMEDHNEYHNFVDEVNRLYKFNKIYIQSNFTDLIKNDDKKAI
jgi:pyruvate-formate lyase-activating enzyme